MSPTLFQSHLVLGCGLHWERPPLQPALLPVRVTPSTPCSTFLGRGALDTYLYWFKCSQCLLPTKVSFLLPETRSSSYSRQQCLKYRRSSPNSAGTMNESDEYDESKYQDSFPLLSASFFWKFSKPKLSVCTLVRSELQEEEGVLRP